jgi:drug/metabolite transporter (DMT)-like permease
MIRPKLHSADAGNARYAALVPVLGLLWGFNWPAVKIVLVEIAPWTLRATGLLSAGLILACLAVVRGYSLSVRCDHWMRLIVAGLLSVAGFNVLLAFAQLAAPTSRSVVVTFTMPLWASLFARVVLGERFDRRRILGLGCGVAGLAALAWPLLHSGQFSIGLLYALGGGISWAAGTVFMKRFPVQTAPLTNATWQVLTGGVCAALGMLVFEGLPSFRYLGQVTILALVYHVVLAQALAYFLWFEIVSRAPAGIAALGTLMVPVVGFLGAMFLLGERPTGTDLFGLCLITVAAAAVLIPNHALATRNDIDSKRIPKIGRKS